MRRRILVVAVCVAAAVAVFALTRHEAPKTHLRLARLSKPEATDVSSARAPQSEVAVAVDPTRAAVAVAGSNDLGARRMRVYSSVDGGSRWRSGALPLPSAGVCGTSDPSVAIDRTGQQFYSFLGIYCLGGKRVYTRVYVATRAGPAARWHAPLLAVKKTPPRTLADDRPSITVDNGADSPHRGRLYMGWTRFSIAHLDFWIDPDASDVELFDVSALVSHSDDEGRHWSTPVVVSQQGDPLEVRLATARNGTVYATWRESKTNATTSPPLSTDESSGRRSSGRVYVVWGSTGLNQSQDVYVAAFDPDLRPLLGVGHLKQVNPAEGFPGPDQFLPTAAVDQSSGDLWACYYQTLGRSHRRARFTCTMSQDGAKTWLPTVAATTVPSDESRKPANVANGYGDYEGVAATGDGALATWTDGRQLKRLGEEIYSARLGVRERR